MMHPDALMHLILSVCKSLIRLLGCVAVFIDGMGLEAMAAAFFIAELIGIGEELV
jgi:hypothetical protein